MNNSNSLIILLFFPAETDIVATCIVIRDGVPRSVAICRVVRDGVPGAVATCRVIRDGVPEFVATCRVVRDGVPKSVATCRVVRDGVPDCVAACTISAPPVSMRKLGTSFFKTKREGGNFSEKLLHNQPYYSIRSKYPPYPQIGPPFSTVWPCTGPICNVP